MAITLSMLITRSATMMVLTAPHSLSLPWMLSCPSSSSGAISLTPIQSSSSPPTSFRNGTFSSVNAKAIRITRSTMAPTVPHTMPLVRCALGSWRQANAITTALSPPSRMSIRMICPTATQKCAVRKSSMGWWFC